MRELMNKGVASESLEKVIIAKCDSECAIRVEEFKKEINGQRAADKKELETKYIQLNKAWAGISKLNENLYKDILKLETKVKQIDATVGEVSQKQNDGTLQDLVKQVKDLASKVTLLEQRFTNLATKVTKNEQAATEKLDKAIAALKVELNAKKEQLAVSIGEEV